MSKCMKNSYHPLRSGVTQRNTLMIKHIPMLKASHNYHKHIDICLKG